jgi:hypothetical protein
LICISIIGRRSTLSLSLSIASCFFNSDLLFYYIAVDLSSIVIDSNVPS